MLLFSHGIQSIKHLKMSMSQLCVLISPHIYPSKCVYILFTSVSQESSRPPRVHLVRPCVPVSSTLSSSCVCVIVKPFPSGELEDNLTNAPVPYHSHLLLALKEAMQIVRSPTISTRSCAMPQMRSNSMLLGPSTRLVRLTWQPYRTTRNNLRGGLTCQRHAPGSVVVCED